MYRDNLTYIAQIPGLLKQDAGGERIWQRYLAALRTVAQLCVQWGFFDMNVPAIGRFTVNLLQDMRNELQEVSPDPLTRLNEVLRSLAAKSVFVETSKPRTKGDMVQLVGGGTRIADDIVMRQERDTGKTYVHAGAFTTAAGAYSREILTFCRTHSLCEDKLRRGVRLKAYLGGGDAQVNCYVFDQKAIDAMTNDAKGSAVIDTYDDLYEPPQRSVPHLRPVK